MELIFFIALCAFANAAKMGPIGKVELDIVENCEEDYTNDKMSFVLNLKKMDGKDAKAVSGHLKNNIPIDNTFEYEMEVTGWESSGWKPVLKRRGSLCTDAVLFAGNLIANIAKTYEPNIPPVCPVPPGSYILNNFRAATTDFKIPVIYYGRLRLIFKVLVGDQVLTCIVGEGSSRSLI